MNEFHSMQNENENSEKVNFNEISKRKEKKRVNFTFPSLNFKEISKMKRIFQ